MAIYPAFIRKRSTGVVTRFDPELWESKEWEPFGPARIRDDGNMASDGSDFDQQVAKQEARHSGASVRISSAKPVKQAKEQDAEDYKIPATVDFRSQQTPVQPARLTEPDTPLDEKAKPIQRRKRAPKAGIKARLAQAKTAPNVATA